MPKTLIALITSALFAFPLAANANCNLDNTGGSTPSKTCDSDDVSNLNRSVELQASDGVNIDATNDGNDIAVGACHKDGSSGFIGSSGGGSITENTDFDNSNCSGATYSEIST